MRRVGAAVSTRAQNLHPAWDDENLTSPFGQSLARSYASLIVFGLTSLAAIVYALVAVNAQ